MEIACNCQEIPLSLCADTLCRYCVSKCFMRHHIKRHPLHYFLSHSTAFPLNLHKSCQPPSIVAVAAARHRGNRNFIAKTVFEQLIESNWQQTVFSAYFHNLNNDPIDRNVFFLSVCSHHTFPVTSQCGQFEFARGKIVTNVSRPFRMHIFLFNCLVMCGHANGMRCLEIGINDLWMLNEISRNAV